MPLLSKTCFPFFHFPHRKYINIQLMIFFIDELQMQKIVNQEKIENAILLTFIETLMLEYMAL